MQMAVVSAASLRLCGKDLDIVRGSQARTIAERDFSRYAHDLAPAEETQTDDIEQRHEHEHDAPQIHGQLEQPRKAQVLLLGGIHHTASLEAHGTSGACR